MRAIHFLPLSLLLVNSCGALLDAISAEEGELSYLSSALSVADTALNIRENLSPFNVFDTFSATSPFGTLKPLASCSVGSGITESSCTSNAKTYSYSDCQGRFTGATYSGALNLSFSNAGCSLSLSSGQTMSLSTTTFTTRSADGTSINWSSASNTVYSGGAFGGGIQLEGAGGAFLDLRIPGITRRKIVTDTGSEVYEHVVSTSNDLTVATGFESGQRNVSGNMSVHSNSGEYTASLTLTALIWGSNACCYPTAGTVSVTFGGSRSGSKDYTFEGSCGKIRESSTGQDFTLDSCL